VSARGVRSRRQFVTQRAQRFQVLLESSLVLEVFGGVEPHALEDGVASLQLDVLVAQRRESGRARIWAIVRHRVCHSALHIRSACGHAVDSVMQIPHRRVAYRV
jgi:hypothetical protein